MKHVIRIAALLIALGLIAHAPARADKNTEGDWAGGWTTWKNAAKGDWAEYSSSAGHKVRWDVLDVTGDKVKYSRKTYNTKGEETLKQEKEQAWNSINLTMKLPYNTKVEWSEETLTLSGVELKCDVAKYTKGESTDTLYYCKDVPCGGFVKIVMNGKETNWLSAFQKAGGTEVKEDPKDPKEEPKVESKSKLPRFYADASNSAIIKLSGTGRDATYQLRQIVSVEENSSKYTVVACDEEGNVAAGAKPVEREQTKEDWDKLYAKPSEKGVKLTVAAGEFVCDVFKTTEDGKETTEWVSEGAPVKKVIKAGEKETILEAIKITMK